MPRIQRVALGLTLLNLGLLLLLVLSQASPSPGQANRTAGPPRPSPRNRRQSGPSPRQHSGSRTRDRERRHLPRDRAVPIDRSYGRACSSSFTAAANGSALGLSDKLTGNRGRSTLCCVTLRASSES